jgi:outer membrane receptor protein involved in Fe transport
MILGDYLNALPTAPMYYDIYENKPYQIASYVQDRMDWGGIVLRLGLRFDYFDSRAKGIINPYDTTAWAMAKADYRLCPRIGFSFPVTQTVKFRFNYGHFQQLAPMPYLYSYSNPATVMRIARSGAILGNPELRSKKTIQYEIGFENQLSDVLSFDFTAYFKDIYDLETVRQVVALPTNYLQYRNADYGNVKGFEFSLNRRLAQYWHGRLTYTLQYAKGTGSDANEAAYDYYWSSIDPVTGERPPLPSIDFWLDFDERHVVIADLGVQFPKEFQFWVLRDALLSTVTGFHSGQPYTPTNLKGERLGSTNSARKPSYINTDAMISKNVPVGPLGVALYCSVNNLFNSTQVRSVYSSSGRADWDNADPNYSPGAFSSFTVFSSYYHPACDFNHDGIATNTERFLGYMDARHFIQNSPDNYMPSFRIRLGASIKI